MKLKVLSLNCQKNYNPKLSDFLADCLRNRDYDVFLLQEASSDVLKFIDNFPRYKIVNGKLKDNRHSLSCVVFDCKKFNLRKYFYEPILLEEVERDEKFGSFHSYGASAVLLEKEKVKIGIGSIHLPAGFSSKNRTDGLFLTKKLFGNLNGSDISFYGGDCNFCLPFEIKNACRVVAPEYSCVTHDLGITLNSRYTESNLPYSFIKINSLLKRIGISLKFRTDHFFVNSKNVGRVIETKILEDRVSDHSPIEMTLAL